MADKVGQEIAQMRQTYRFTGEMQVTTFSPQAGGGSYFSWFTVPAGVAFTYLDMYVPTPGSDSVPEHRIRVADGREGYVGQAVLPGSEWVRA